MKESRHAAVLGITVLDVHLGRHPRRTVAPRDFYALTYRFAGKVTIEAGGVRVLSAPDTVTFTPAGMSYKTSIREDTHMIAVHFRLSEELSFRKPAVISAADTQLSSLFSELKERYSVTEPLDFECMSIFYRILSELERIGYGTSPIPHCVREAKRYIDERFSDAELSVSALSSQTGVSDSYLRRAFRAFVGLSPAQYLSRVRLTRAMELLQSEYLTVSEIAQRCGYHSTGYFIQAFHAQTGCSPGAYRKQRTQA
ncbi:MAG: AraC family transcriptional regulator [Ruminococcaceae bacterium]|nr:AraC family transcriptional regulator [Oscillospiraceae bacterium]